MVLTTSSIFNFRNYILFSLLLLTISCTNTSRNSQTDEQIESQKQLILNIHDDLMPDMSEFKKLTKALNIIEGDSILEENVRNSSSEAILNLQLADKAMWDWMHQFNIAFKDNNDSLTLTYYKHQYELIKEVEVLFEESRVEAEMLVLNYARVQ